MTNLGTLRIGCFEIKDEIRNGFFYETKNQEENIVFAKDGIEIAFPFNTIRSFMEHIDKSKVRL